MRLLFCVTGLARCPYCDHTFPIKTVDQVIERIQSLPLGTVVEIRTPVVKIYGEDYPYLFAQLRSRGYRSLVIDGQRYDSGEAIQLDEQCKYTIEAVLDRLIVQEDMRASLEATLQNGMRIGEGFLSFELSHPLDALSPERLAQFYGDFACPDHHVAMRDLEPYYFSFNDPDSACKTCGGLGMVLQADPRLLVVNPRKSIRQGGLSNTFLSVKHPYKYTLLYSLARHYGFSLDMPFGDLPEKAKQVIFYGTAGEKIELLDPPDAPRRAAQVGQRIAYEG
ncbi:MAG: excinuclease ABC subunit UvrA, partial [Chloroflexota bacterium]